MKKPKHAIPLWAWPNILSLDVVLIGVTWQRLIAQTLGLECTLSASWVLGLSIWLTYMGDRWLDGIRLKKAYTYRHEVIRSFKWPLFGLWLLILFLDVFIAIDALPPQSHLLGLGLLMLCILYTCSIQQGHHSPSLTKEAKVALIFCLGIFIFITPTSTQGLLPLSIYFGLLSLLFWSNASLIAHWEKNADMQHQSTSLATAYPTIAAYAHWVALIIAALCLPLISINTASTPFALACATSGILLFTINTLNYHRELRRVLADAALLTPIIILGWL